MLLMEAPPFVVGPRPRLAAATTCDRHPDETFTGFCASCLRERLAELDSASAVASAPGRKSTSAIKALFSKVSGAGAGGPQPSTLTVRPDLRRCRSFSCGRGDVFQGPRPAAAAAMEPQRRSCDVRGRSTLWSLFHQDDGVRSDTFAAASSSSAVPPAGEIEAERPNRGFPHPCVPEMREEEDEELDGGDEIRQVDPVLVVGTSGEIDAMTNPPPRATVAANYGIELKPMKDHIDLESQSKRPPPKDLKEIAGSFWLAASVFSKKWQKWRGKQKLKKQGGDGSKAAAAAMPPEKPPRPWLLRGQQRLRPRDAQSELAADAFGRRSCDTDPRFSLDAGRMSFDDPRFSWDEPRASWDGYLIGGRPVPSRIPPMLAVAEDAPVPAVERSDGHIPVEDDAAIPGGSVQTRDYYSDSSRRRRSLDRSSSVRRSSVEENDCNAAANGRESPAGGAEFYHLHHAGSFLDRDLSTNSLKDDMSTTLESAFRDPHKGAPAKKPRRWSKAWSIWGLIHRRGGGKETGNGVDRSFSESWPELRDRGYSGKILRSNSSLSARSSFSRSGSFRSSRRCGGGVESNGVGKKRREEFVLERNRSARYSPGRIENGMLRMYLTPMRSSSGGRRSGGGGATAGKAKQMSSQSYARSIFALY